MKRSNFEELANESSAVRYFVCLQCSKFPSTLSSYSEKHSTNAT